MKSEQLKSREEYDLTMKMIEAILQKATKLGGFDQLSTEEADRLTTLSLLVEEWENNNL